MLVVQSVRTLSTVFVSPVDRSHTLAVKSQLPVASCRPSGLKATLLTLSVWPWSGRGEGGVEWIAMVKGVDMNINKNVLICVNMCTLQEWGAYDVRKGGAHDAQ